LSKKLAADKKKSESTDKKYRKEIEKVVVIETRMYDTEMPRTLAQMEDLERQRIELVKSTSANVALGRARAPSSHMIADCCHATPFNVRALSLSHSVSASIRSGRSSVRPVVRVVL